MRLVRRVFGYVFIGVCAACCAFSNSIVRAEIRYTVTDLGLPPGTYDSTPYAINSSGQVIGGADSFNDEYGHPFLYDGTLHELGALDDHFQEYQAINDSGQVVIQTGRGSYHRTFIWLPTISNGTTGTAQEIGNLLNARGTAINNVGQVTGSVEASFTHGYVFLFDGAMHNLGTLGGPYGRGNGINAVGQITGNAAISDFVQHAFIWTPSVPNGATGSMLDIGTLGGDESYGSAINKSGHVVGVADVSSIPGGPISHAFFYDTSMHDLGTLGGLFSFCAAINDKDEAVGESEYPQVSNDRDPPLSAFLWTSTTGMVDLNTLIDPQSGWQLADAKSINNSGQIVGSGSLNGVSRPFLLTPVPEPSGLLLAGVGVVGLGMLSRKRILNPIHAIAA